MRTLPFNEPARIVLNWDKERKECLVEWDGGSGRYYVTPINGRGVWVGQEHHLLATFKPDIQNYVMKLKFRDDLERLLK